MLNYNKARLARTQQRKERDMKKKITVLGIVASMLLTTVGCGNKYVTLGEYKDLKVEYTCDQSKITDEDVDSKITSNLEEYATEAKDKNYKAKNGDTVNIDYKGLKDGKAFDGGTAEGYDLKLGSNSFIDGFEDKLVGAKKGEKRSLDLTFPEDYSESSLAGKDVVFKVTVNSIKVTPTLDDLTDEFVKEKIKDYSTVKEYRAAVKKELQESLDESIESAKEKAAWEKVVANAKVKSYPKDQVDELKKQMEDYYTQYANYYGMELDDFIKQTGSTKEEFDEKNEESAKSEVASRLIAEAIGDKENISISDDEYKQGVKDYMKEYNYSTEKDLLDAVGEDTIRVELLRTKVQKFVVEHSTLTPKKSTEQDTTSTENK